MNKKNIIIIQLALLLSPLFASAGTISFITTSDTVHVGDTIVIQAMLDTEGEVINVIDGELSFSDSKSFTISEISTANSQFSLWPNKPSVDTTRSSISFIGGVPKGISGSNIPLFKIVVEPKEPGVLAIQTKQISQYLNDGKGTAATVSVSPISITSKPNTGQMVVNEWTEIVKKDTKPPRKFAIDLGRDPSVYDNRYFISFNAVDDDSGIDYYEVQEGSLSKVRSGSPYVLQNQNPNEKITVVAYDNAGNTYEAILHKTNTLRNALFGIGIAMLLLFFVRKYKRKKFTNETF